MYYGFYLCVLNPPFLMVLYNRYSFVNNLQVYFSAYIITYKKYNLVL